MSSTGLHAASTSAVGTTAFPYRPAQALDAETLARLDAWWRTANYLSIGQIYLLDNPLLRTPLTVDHIKPRLLGHWGTTPGLNFVYAHLNRVIRQRRLNTIFVTGPGHGGPGMVANAYLDGTYSELHPHIGLSEDGLRQLFRQFSFPGGIPSHASPETPGSIHEGGELGYALSHAYGAAFDNPSLLVAAVVGDGEAETGPLATSWHSNKFLNPLTDGVVLPILHLNGYKIANPTVLARIPATELRSLLEGYGHAPVFVEGAEPGTVHRFDAASGPLPSREFRSSTHALGIGETVELARALGRLPARLVVFGIEGESFGSGGELSGGARTGVERAVELVLEEAGCTTGP